MTTELTKAAQQALERLKIHKGSAYCDACEAEDDEVIAELERALTQHPAAQEHLLYEDGSPGPASLPAPQQATKEPQR